MIVYLFLIQYFQNKYNFLQPKLRNSQQLETMINKKWIFILHFISGLLPWSPGLLHRDGQSSRDCHPHLGGNLFIVGCGNFFLGGRKFEHLKPDICLCGWLNIQGSVVVFGSWPNWTSEDMTSADYCMETPMLFAFVLQIVRWVRKIGKTSTGWE